MSADKIKKFFSRKKEEAKFKLNLNSSMGQGRTCNTVAENPAVKKKSGDSNKPQKRKILSEEAKAAAAAAILRVNKSKNSGKEFNTSLAAIRAQVKREQDAERKNEIEEEEVQHPNTNLACQDVYFKCPFISAEILPKSEWKIKIKEFLYQQLEMEKGLTACLIIQNCNAKEKAAACVETLKKYIENLINHPDEEKYFKIRMSNRIFCERVRPTEGSIEFLEAAGFREFDIDEETFLIWSAENMENNIDLTALVDALENAEPLPLELDRNIHILLPSQAKKQELPPAFYRISQEELKREQQLRTTALENAQVLKTKAMREREELRNLNKYRFTLLRVRFPDGFYLQGTFNVYEKLSDVYDFVQSCLFDEEHPFDLVHPAGLKFHEEDMNKSLFDLKLVPNILLMFSSDSSSSKNNYLKEDLLMMTQLL